MQTMYYAAVEGHILGQYRKAGDEVGRLTEKQAQYLLLAGHVTEKAKPSPAPKRTRSEPKAKAEDDAKADD